MWRERFDRGIVHADIEPSSDVPFKTLHATRIEEVRHAFHAFADGDDSIGIIVSSPSRSQLSQRGQEIDLRAGDAIAILHSDPATVTYLEGLQFGPAVPRDALTPRVTNVDSLTMRPMFAEPKRSDFS
jgi:hypothetical protein